MYSICNLFVSWFSQVWIISSLLREFPRSYLGPILLSPDIFVSLKDNSPMQITFGSSFWRSILKECKFNPHPLLIIQYTQLILYLVLIQNFFPILISSSSSPNHMLNEHCSSSSQSPSSNSPSVSLALPPVDWQRTVEHPEQTTTVCAWEKTWNKAIMRENLQ